MTYRFTHPGAAHPVPALRKRNDLAVLPLEQRILLDANLEWGINSTTALTSVLSGIMGMFGDEFDQVTDFLAEFEDLAETASDTLNVLVKRADADDADLTPTLEAIQPVRDAIDKVRDAVQSPVNDWLDSDFAATVASQLETWIQDQNLTDPVYNITITTAQIAELYTLTELRNGTLNASVDTFIGNLGNLGLTDAAATRVALDGFVATSLGMETGNFKAELSDIEVDGVKIVEFKQNGADKVDVEVHLPKALIDLTTFANEAMPGFEFPLDVVGQASGDAAFKFQIASTFAFVPDGDDNPTDVIASVGLSISNFDFAPLLQVGGEITVPTEEDALFINLGLLSLELSGLETAQLQVLASATDDLDLGFTVNFVGGFDVAWNKADDEGLSVDAMIKALGADEFEVIDATKEYGLLRASFDGDLDFGGDNQEFTTQIDLLSKFEGSALGDRLQSFIDNARFTFDVKLTDEHMDPEVAELLGDAIGSLATMGVGQIVDFLKDVGTSISGALRDAAFDVSIPLTDIRLSAIMDQLANVFNGLASLFTVDEAALGTTEMVLAPGGDFEYPEVIDSRLENEVTEITGIPLALAAIEKFDELTFRVVGGEEPVDVVVTLTGADVLDGDKTTEERRQSLMELLHAALESHGFAFALAATGGLTITQTATGDDRRTVGLVSARKVSDEQQDESQDLRLLGIRAVQMHEVYEVTPDEADETEGPQIKALRFTEGQTEFEFKTLDLDALDGMKTLRLSLEVDGRKVKLDVPATKPEGGFATLNHLIGAINGALDKGKFGITAKANGENDGLAFEIDADETRNFVLRVDPGDLLKAVDIDGLIAIVNTEIADVLGGGTKLELTSDGALVLTFPKIEVLLELGVPPADPDEDFVPLHFNTDSLGLGTVTGLSLSAQLEASLKASLGTAVGIDLVGFGAKLLADALSDDAPADPDAAPAPGSAFEVEASESVLKAAVLDNVFITDIGLQANAFIKANEIRGSASVGLLGVDIGADDASKNFLVAEATLDATLIGRALDGTYNDRITLRQLKDLITTDFEFTGEFEDELDEEGNPVLDGDGNPVKTDVEKVTRVDAQGISSLIGRFELLGGIVVDGEGQGLDSTGEAVDALNNVLIIDPFDPDEDNPQQTAQLLVRLGDVKVNVLGVEGINEGLIDGISLTIADLSRISETFELALLGDNEELQKAIDGLSALDSGDILDSLVAIANMLSVIGDTLTEKLPFLEAKIPLLNFSILDKINFAADFLTAVQEIRNDPQAALDSVRAQMETVFGQNTVKLEWDSEKTTILFDLSFKFLENYSESLPFNFDLAQILGDQLAGILGDDLADIVTGLVDVAGDGELVFDPQLAMTLSFGIDLSKTLQTPSDTAETETKLGDLHTTSAVNYRPNGGNDIRFIHTAWPDPDGEPVVTRIEIDADGFETLGDLVAAINTALSNETDGISTLSFEYDDATGKITLRDSAAFSTDDAGVKALFDGPKDSALSDAALDADKVQFIGLDEEFDDWAGAYAFSLVINGVAVNVKIAEDADRTSKGGFINAFNKALVETDIDRTAVSSSSITGMTIPVSQLIKLVENDGKLELVATNYAQANKFDAITFAVAAEDTSVQTSIRIQDLGGANLSRVLGFGANSDGGGELVSVALFKDVEFGAPRIYLDTEKTEILAEFTAGVNDGLNLKLGLGPMEVQVVNGKALITGGEGHDTAFIRLGINDIDGDDNVGQYDLSHLFEITSDPDVSFADLFSLDFGLGIDIDLPLQDSIGLLTPDTSGLEWSTTLIATQDGFDLSNPDLDGAKKIVGDLVDGFDADNINFRLPDLGDFFANLNVLDLLNNPRMLLGGIDLIMNQMQKQFDRYLSNIKLPVVGDAIGAGVTFFQDFRIHVIQAALEYANKPKDDGTLPTTVDLLTGFVNDALNSMLGTTGVTYMQAHLDTSAGNAQDSFIYGVLNFNAVIFDADMAIDFDLGIPGFSLNVDQGSKVRMALDYAVNIGFGYDANGFFLLNDTTDAEVAIGFTVDAGTFEGSMTLLNILGISAKAVTLDGNGKIINGAPGTARVTAMLEADLFGDTGHEIASLDDRPDGAKPVDGGKVYRSFDAFDLKGIGGDVIDGFDRVVYLGQLDTSKLIAFDFVASFDIQLGLEANILDPSTKQPLLIGGTQILPSVMTEIVFNGQFTISTGLQIDKILFNQVRVDASVLYEAVIKPVLDPIMQFVGPIADFFSFLNSPPASYIVALARNLFPIIGIVADVAKVLGDINNFVNGLSSTGGQIIFGDFDFSANAAEIQTGEKALTSVDQRDIQRIQINVTNSITQFGSTGFSINLPLLTDPFSAINILMGKYDQVDLVRVDFRLFDFEIKNFDPVQKLLDSMGMPGWVKGIVSGFFSASFDARLKAGFGAGYDLSGIVNFVNTYDPVRLLDGVFIDARPGALIDAYIGGRISLNAGLAGLTASAYAGVQLSFNDIDGDGKLRISELIRLLEAAVDEGGGNILGYLFKGNASVGFALSVWAGIKLGFINLTWEKEVFDISASIDFGGNLPLPTLAENPSKTGGTAILNVGARAGAAYGPIKTDGDDRITVTTNSPLTITHEQGNLYSNGTVNGATALIIPAGEGNNVIDLGGITTGIPTITYAGKGADQFTLPATGLHVVFAGGGDYTITAAPNATGTYIIFGQGGENTVDIAGGNVIFFADSDFGMRAKFLTQFAQGGVTEAAIRSLLNIDEDGKVVAGAANYVFENQNLTLSQLLDIYTVETQLRATSADQTITIGSGGTGNHLILSGAGDYKIHVAEHGTTGTVRIYAGDGDDHIIVGGGNIFVEAGAGSDYVKVNSAAGGASEVWGWAKAGGEAGLLSLDELTGVERDNAIAINALAIRDGNDVIIGGAGSDVFYGQIGDDILLGNMGDDTLYGGLGNDILAGGMLQVIIGEQVKAFDEIDFTLPLTSGIILSVMDLDDGDDVLYGGAGDDILLGGGGRDLLHGNRGNNILVGDFADVHLSANRIAERVVATHILSDNNGTDTLNGGAGNDILMGGGTSPGPDEFELLKALLGNNVVVGDFADMNGARLLEAMTYLNSLASTKGGADKITTGRGNDVIVGGEGDDTIISGLGGDIILGGNGEIDILAGKITAFGLDSDGNDLITLGTDPEGAGIDPDTGLFSPPPPDLLDIVLGGLGDDTVVAADGGIVFLGDAGNVTLDPVALNALRNFRPVQFDPTDTSPEAEAAREADARARELVGAIVREIESAPNANDGDDSLTTTGGNVTAVLGGGSDTADLGDGLIYVLGDDGKIVVEQNADFTGQLVTLTTAASLAANRDDTISVADTADGRAVIVGGEGNDTISLGDGDNAVLGDSGQIIDDTRDPNAITMQLVSHADTEDGNDVITSGHGRNRIIAGGGNDAVTVGNGGNLIIGDSGTITETHNSIDMATTDDAIGGADTVVAGSGDDLVILGAGADEATIEGGNNIVLGDSGTIALQENDLGVISTGSDLENGNDTIQTGYGDDVIIAGLGDDSVTALGGNNVIIGDMGQVTLEEGTDPGRAREAVSLLQGTGGDDTITAGDGHDVIIGGAGADLIYAGGGEDVILGDDGIWISSHMTGLGTVESAVRDTGFDDVIYAGAGNDIVIGGLGNNYIDVGAGEDVAMGDDGVITFRNRTDIESIVMTNVELGGNDTITAEGTEGDNILMGMAGHDLITGGNDDDLIVGDIATFRFGTYLDVLPGQSAVNRLQQMVGIRPDLGFNDTLFGGAGDDMIMGGFGDDRIYGGTGQDFMIGDSAIVNRNWKLNSKGTISEVITIDSNFAFTRGGYDILYGTLGPNVMIGGLGPDLFHGDTQFQMIFSDSFAGIFRATWSALGYEGPTPHRMLYTSNFAGPNAVDVVSRAQQSDSIGVPLSNAVTMEAQRTVPEEGDDLTDRISRGAATVDVTNAVLGLLSSDRYIAAIAQLSAMSVDMSIMRDTIMAALVQDLGALADADGITFELMMRRIVEIFLEAFEVELDSNLSGMNVHGQADDGEDSPEAA